MKKLKFKIRPLDIRLPIDHPDRTRTARDILDALINVNIIASERIDIIHHNIDGIVEIHYDDTELKLDPLPASKITAIKQAMRLMPDFLEEIN